MLLTGNCPACFAACAVCRAALIRCCGLGCRAQILAKKVSARAFKVVPGKQGETAGDIGIEGTAIEAPTEASLLGIAAVHFLLLHVTPALINQSVTQLTCTGSQEMPCHSCAAHDLAAEALLCYEFVLQLRVQ